MPLQTIRTALDELQRDPEQPEIWVSLDAVVDSVGPDADEYMRLIAAARHEHHKRREWFAVATLLSKEAKLAAGSPRETEPLRQEARVRRENLMQEPEACQLYQRILELDPGDHEAAAALEDSRGKRDDWNSLVDTYLAEAENAPDDLYRSSMSMRAAEVELRFGGDSADRGRVVERLSSALSLDPRNERAAELLELIYREDGDFEKVVEVLTALSQGADSQTVSIAAGVRAARVSRHRLRDAQRSADFYRQVLAAAPAHSEALDYLSEFYAGEGRWDELEQVYEQSLSGSEPNSRERLGDVHRIASLLWKEKRDPVRAEVWFERLRKLDPSNGDMLDFFREILTDDAQAQRLLQILSAAQRLMPSGPPKQALTGEVARLAAGHEDPKKAIEQYRNLLRQDPSNDQALQALKQLYRVTQSYHALVELLRQQLEGVAAENVEERVAILAEVAELYREQLASDTALVSVLNQLAQLAPNDVAVARELVHLYEKLGRWRDLLTSQQRLAGLTEDKEEKLELMRAAGRRWLDQFSNVQNATAAFEALLEVAPSDAEARDRLRELYKKRRAWASLYKLYELELPATEGQARLALLQEMAALASERLGKGEEAVGIYRQVLETDPSNQKALAALERQAERAKDWGTLAEALERRAEQTEATAQKMAVLQKLGGVYADHLQDGDACTRTFLRVLELSPGHARALRVLRDNYLKARDYEGLENLYESQSDWDGLAEVLSNAADRAELDEDKIELSYRAASIYADKLDQPERTFRCYERILSVTPGDLRAAQALIPIYEKEEKWARLPALYELCLERESDREAKGDLLQRLIRLTGTRLVDRGRALTYACQAFSLRPDLPQSLVQLEDASRAARDWAPFVEVVTQQLHGVPTDLEAAGTSEDRDVAEAPIETAASKKRKRRRKKKNAEATEGGDAAPLSESGSSAAQADAVHLDEATVRALEMKLAVVYDEYLGLHDEAAELLTGLLERDPSDREAATVLEQWLRRDGKRDQLRALWDIQLEQNPEPETRISLLSDWANLEQSEFASTDRAAQLYRKILDVQPGRLSAVRALPQLLLRLDRPSDAAEVLEQQRSHVAEEVRADLDVELSELYMGVLAKPSAALRAAQRTLSVAPDDARAIEILRKLAEQPATQREAAEALADTYARGADARREAEALERALDAVTEVSERKQLFVRLADVQELKLDSYAAAFETLLRCIREVGDDLSLWDRAEKLASQCGRVTELAHVLRDALRADVPADLERELCDRAARIHEETLGDPVAAVPYLERLLAGDASDQAAFLRLKQILTSAERWGELEDLYNRATQAIEDEATRVDLLTEVALVCEEIIEDDSKAVGYYERTLEIAPRHDVSLRALDRLYQRTGAFAKLADLLTQRLEELEEDEALDVALRLAQVQLEHLHQPGEAIEHVELVLLERPADYTARQLAEEILSIASYKLRAAEALESVYEARDEVRELVKVLEIRWDASSEETDPDKVEARGQLLRRIATLKDERLHDDIGSLEAYLRYVPEHPADLDARERLVEIGQRRGEFAKVAKALEQAASGADDLMLRGEILMQAAGIYARSLADTERAESIYRRVLELDPSEVELTLPAAVALEGLYEAAERFDQLVEMLRIRIRLELDGEARAELLRRVGELSETRLRDAHAAIEAYRSLLEEVGDHPGALEALDRLYEATEQWRSLVEVIELRRQITVDLEARQQLMRRQAAILFGSLSDATEAIEVWRGYRAEFGDTEEALSALETLYRDSERWEDLADTYEAHLASSDEPEERLKLLTALGDLRGEQLQLPQAALDAYREALGVDFSYRPARLALERLLESTDQLTQREAAEVLEPVFEADGDHQRLLKVLEIQAQGETDPIRKLSVLGKCADVAENSLLNPDRTMGYITAAVREGAGHTELEPWLQRLERVADVTNRRADQVALLRDIVVDIFEGDLQFSVTLQIARLARDELRDSEMARDYFEKALDLRSDALEPMVALEAIYEETADLHSLLGILERRADIAEGEEEQLKLMMRRAALLRNRLNDPVRATDAYERALELQFDPTAIAALESLYAEAERWEDLVDLLRRQLDSPGVRPAELHVRIAKAAAREMGDLPRAFDALEAALEADRHNSEAVSELEFLMEEGTEAEFRSRAASLLEPIYLSTGRYDRVMATVASRLEYSQDPEERRELLTSLAKLHEEQKEDYPAALATVAKLLSEDVTSEETVAELERLARVAECPLELARIYSEALENVVTDEPATAKMAQRAAQLYAAADNFAQGQLYYRRALTFNPDDREVFAEFDALLARAEDHQARVELYRTALDTRFEDSERVALLHQMAELLAGPLAQPEAAVDAHRQALDVDPEDSVSLDALSQLYRSLGQWSELAEHCLARVDATDEPSEAAVHRLVLARLRANELSDIEGAVDQLEEIVQALPEHTEALEELERLRRSGECKERIVDILLPLYEAADDWRRLIKLNEDRFSMAQDSAEKVAVLRETANLWERRGQDLDRARRGLAVAFELDPDDESVRQDYERLVEQTEAWDELAGVYQERLKVDDLACRFEVLSKLASVHDERRNDPRRALAAYERLVELDETDVQSLEKLEQLATMLSDWPVVVRALRIKTESVHDPEECARLWRQVGETRRDMLEQRDLAIEAYERASELEPDNTFTLDNLIELYQQRQDVERLVELYQRRVDLSGPDDLELKYDLLCSAGKLYEEQQRDNVSAVDMYNQALALKPSDQAVLEKVSSLYRAEEMWSELLENLRFCVSVAESDEQRAEYRIRMAGVLADQLGEYEEALETYREVLNATEVDERAIEAVRTIGTAHVEQRELAASILVPALTTLERHEQLVDALEMRLSSEADPPERATTLQQMATVLESRLGDSGRAQSVLLRALTEQPESNELHAEIVRLSEQSDRFGDYAVALTDRAQATFDTDLAMSLYARLGEVSEHRLNDPAGAIQAYQEAVRQAGDQPELLEALDRLYRRVEDFESLAEVLERRALIAEGDEAQAELYFRMGQIHLERFRDNSRSLFAFRQALEYCPSHEGAVTALEGLLVEDEFFDEVSEVLESVYRETGNTGKLAALFERRVGQTGTPEQRMDARRTLARVLEEEVGDAAQAQRIVQQGLAEMPGDLSQLEELERLARLTDNWEEAATCLESVLEEVSRSEPATGRVVALTLASWRREQLQDGVGAERALMVALECSHDAEEILQQLEELQSVPGREGALIETLVRRSQLAVGTEREELIRRAKDLTDGLSASEVGQWTGENLLRQLLKAEPDNDWALESLAEICLEKEDFAQTLELLERRIEGGMASQPLALRHQAALLAWEKLNDEGRAAQLYLQLLEQEPGDSVAVNALRKLLAAAQRWEDLRELLVRQVDVSELPDERLSLRLELARLDLDCFDSPDAAIEQLNAVLDEEPGHTEAVLLLGRLFEKQGRFSELAELLEQQVDVSEGRGDVAGALQLLTRLAELSEERLSNLPRAVETYQRILQHEPAHSGACDACVRIFRAEGRFEDAADVIEAALGDLSDAERVNHLNTTLSELYEQLGQPDRACEALERLVDSGAAGPEVVAKLRGLYEGQENWARLADLIVSQAEGATNVEAKVSDLSAAARLYTERLSEPETAASLLQTATDLAPDNRPVLLQLCDVLNDVGRSREAAETLQKIVQSYGGRRSKELGEIHRRLAMAYRAQGEADQAMAELELAFRIEPGNVAILHELGSFALQQGVLKKAQQMYRALLLQRLDENSPITKAEVFYNLGRVHDALGEKPKARQMLERALQTDGTLDAARQLLQQMD